MQTVSVAIIAQDEEEVLPMTLECLAGIPDVIKEVVIVDGGSKDGTRGVIEMFEDRLPITALNRKFDTFRDQKNFALDNCKGQWVLGLDADMAFNSLKFRELLLAGWFDKTPVWDFRLVFCKGDLNHYCTRSTTSMPTTRFWKNVGLRYEREVHEYLVFPNETGWDSIHCAGKIAYCSEACIFETHMLKSEAALRNRVVRYQVWAESTKAAGLTVPTMAESVDALIGRRWEGVAAIEQPILDKVPSAAFEYAAAQGRLT